MGRGRDIAASVLHTAPPEVQKGSAETVAEAAAVNSIDTSG